MTVRAEGILTDLRVEGWIVSIVWSYKGNPADTGVSYMSKSADTDVVDPRLREGEAIEVLWDHQVNVVRRLSSRDVGSPRGGRGPHIALRWPWSRRGVGAAPALSEQARHLLGALCARCGTSPRQANRGGAFAAMWETFWEKEAEPVGLRDDDTPPWRPPWRAGWELRATGCVAAGPSGFVLTAAGMRSAGTK